MRSAHQPAGVKAFPAVEVETAQPDISARLTPDGEIERLLPLPVPRPTGLAFGGEGKVYVTTARIDLAREVLEKAPLAGHLLVAQTSKG